MLVYVPYLTSWTSLAAKAMRKTVVSLVQRITGAIWKKAIDLVEPDVGVPAAESAQVEPDVGVPAAESDAGVPAAESAQVESDAVCVPEQVESAAQAEPDDDEIMNYEELLEYIKSMNMSVVDVRTGREVWVNDTVESALPSLLADLYKM